MKVEEARRIVLLRDGGCVAPILDLRSGGCFDRWGLPLTRYGSPEALEVDRVRDDPSMGKAPSHEDPFRMVALCPGHHRGTGPSGGGVWATRKESRRILRAYLEGVQKKTDLLVGGGVGSRSEGIGT